MADPRVSQNMVIKYISVGQISRFIKGTIHKGRPQGGGGGLRNLQILRTNSTDRLQGQGGGRGSKIPKILLTSFMNCPKQQIALDVLFQMKYNGIPNSNICS